MNLTVATLGEPNTVADNTLFGLHCYGHPGWIDQRVVLLTCFGDFSVTDQIAATLQTIE